MILQKSKKSPDAEQTSGRLAVPFYPNLSANRLAISSKNSSLSTPRAWKPGSTSPSRSFVIYHLFEGRAIATRREGGTALNFSQQKSFFIQPDKLCSISTEYHKNTPKREAKIGHFQSTISRFDFHSELSAINIIPARHSGPLSFASQVYNLFLCYGFMGCNKRDAPLIRRGDSVRLYVHVLRRYGSRKQRSDRSSACPSAET